MNKRSLSLGISVIFFIALFIWGFVEISSGLNGSEIRGFDNRIISFVQGKISDRLTSVMLVITFFGSVKGVAIITIIVILILFFSRHRLLCLFLAVTIGIGAGVFNRILKLYFKRERPDIHPIIQENGFSFPSGHSMGSMILYGSLAFILVKLAKHNWSKGIGILVGIIIIFVVGVSRIYLGVHYPSDVVGGYIAGAFWLLICITIFEIIGKWHQRKKTN